MKNVLILGGTTFDHIVTLEAFPGNTPQTIHVAPFHEATGSTGAGKALCLTKLGIPNILHSILGDDDWGKKIIQHLVKEKVDFIYDFDPKGTERHFNVMNKEGERISMFITQSSENLSISFDLIEEKIQWADIIVLNIIPYCKQIIPILKKYNKPIWTDLHDYDEGNPYHKPFIDISQYILLSSDNLNEYKPLMQKWIKNGKELVVCTHGKKGATALTKQGEWLEQPAYTAFELIDANGAGDNFFSGLLYGFIKNKPLETSMKYGAICGAYCIASKELVNEKLSAELLESEILNL
jgi:sugar/nucleoside kinase (ribokinase family)